VSGGATDEQAVGLLEGLVGTPSVSGEEGAAVERFVAGARGLGFETRVDEVGNGHAWRGGRGGRGGREIVLLGHIDTVAGEIPARIEDGVLHGRGAVDAKGPLVAMLVGASRVELGEGVGVRVIAAVGEEAHGSPGARHLLESGMARPAACVIGEPSGWDGVTLGYKGRLVARAWVERDNGHSAGGGGSASDRLFEWWVEARSAALALGDVGGDAGAGEFDRVQATLHETGSENDGLRDRAWLVGGFRLPPGVEPRALEERVRAVAGDVGLEFVGAERAHVVDRNDAVVRALSAAIREEGGRPRHKRKTGTADFNVVGPVWGCPIAAYGPGESSLDHTPWERLEVGEFLRSARVLERGLAGLMGELFAS